ncbi:MAG: hypothetical protein A2Y57_00555, partial [Candidatus Woykebacteria bacterium RBG_13_40_7b]
GVDYNLLDAVKKLAQEKSISTAKFLKKVGFSELSESRGESAFVWQQGGLYMAAILECLGTKNLVADEMYKITGKTYYDVIAQDTVATAINDLTALGAKPLTLHAFWGLWNDDWLLDKKRTEDFVKGWERACALAGVTWGGGETPSLTNVVAKGAVVLAASAVGIIKPKSRLMRGNKIKVGDRIVFLKSTGLNANGISLARAVAKKLPKGYATKLPSGKMYGEAVLTKTNIYAKIIQELLDGDVDIHYISNITGHGLRKIMRARQDYTYVVEKTFEPQEVFFFIQKHANLSDFEMYQTFNMGSDYALFLPAGHVKKAQEIVKKNGFKSLDAGYVRKGKRQVIIEPKNLTFKSKTLDLR